MVPHWHIGYTPPPLYHAVRPPSFPNAFSGTQFRLRQPGSLGRFWSSGKRASHYATSARYVTMWFMIIVKTQQSQGTPPCHWAYWVYDTSILICIDLSAFYRWCDRYKVRGFLFPDLSLFNLSWPGINASILPRCKIEPITTKPAGKRARHWDIEDPEWIMHVQYNAVNIMTTKDLEWIIHDAVCTIRYPNALII